VGVTMSEKASGGDNNCLLRFVFVFKLYLLFFVTRSDYRALFILRLKNANQAPMPWNCRTRLKSDHYEESDDHFGGNFKECCVAIRDSLSPYATSVRYPSPVMLALIGANG
jgi:hypothetical protein